MKATENTATNAESIAADLQAKLDEALAQAKKLEQEKEEEIAKTKRLEREALKFKAKASKIEDVVENIDGEGAVKRFFRRTKDQLLMTTLVAAGGIAIGAGGMILKQRRDTRTAVGAVDVQPVDAQDQGNM